MVLHSRLTDDGEETWVSYDTPQTSETFRDVPFIPAHHPTTRNIPNAIRNALLATRVYDAHLVERVVSTGAALAVPFLAEAARRRIPAHYIESATRVSSPSLSGRLLRPVRPVKLYRQLGSWGGPRWMDGPCVFDGYAARPGRGTQPRRVLVSLGTHDFAFPRLVRRLRTILSRSSHDVTWQLGSTPAPAGLPGAVHGHVPSDAFSRLVQNADVVVGHAGVGLSLAVLQQGKVPVLVPRRRSHGEHADNHQVPYAQHVGALGLAVTSDVETLGLHHLERAASLDVTHQPPGPFHLVD